MRASRRRTRIRIDRWGRVTAIHPRGHRVSFLRNFSFSLNLGLRTDNDRNPSHLRGSIHPPANPGSSRTAKEIDPSDPNQSDDYGDNRSLQPPSDSYRSLAQAQESYLQSQQAQANTPDIQFLQAGVNRAHQKQSNASKRTLRQIFPGVDEECVLGGSEG